MARQGRTPTQHRPGVYLLHFDAKLHHAGHYLGSAANLHVRLAQHEAGNGARLTQVIRELGIGYRVSAVWFTPTVREARELERRLKRQKNGRKLCGWCRHVA